MKQKFSDVFAVIVAIFTAIIVILSFVGCDVQSEPNAMWPESAEFSTLETGQERFSMHDTNLGSCDVIVDHETGVEYLVWRGSYKGGITPLLDADGSPMLVSEAG